MHDRKTCDLKISSINQIGTKAINIHLPVNGLSVHPGLVTALIGSNGSGKTTLLEALVGLRMDYKVSAELLGHNVKNFPSVAKSNLGVCFQSSNFSEGIHVRDIIKLHSKSYKMSQDLNLLNVLGISDIMRSRFIKLSGGQRKRLFLYFALAHHPQIAILDEPEASLDSQGLEAVLKCLVVRSQKGFSTLVATHNPTVLSTSERVVYIEKGTVQFSGDKIAFFSSLLGTAVLEVDSKSVSNETVNRVIGHDNLHCFNGARNEKLLVFGDQFNLEKLKTSGLAELDKKSILRDVRASDVFIWLNRGCE